MKLACKVIEDLLPLYCDGACTEDTRALVEHHLQECDSCRGIYDKIQEELSIPCRLIEDLLPLYYDSACSNETRALVDMHLNSCKTCRAKLEEIGSTVTQPPKPDEMKPLKKIQLKWIRSRRKSILKGIIAGMLFVAIATGGYLALTKWRFIEIPLNDIYVTNICQTEDGSIAFHLDVMGLSYLNEIEVQVQGDAAYLVPKRAIFELENDYNGVSNSRFYFITFEPDEIRYYNELIYRNGVPEVMSESEPIGIPDFYLPDFVNSIYVGAPNEGILVWTEGAELPAAGAAIEELYIYHHG